MYQSTTIVGFLGKDPEVRSTPAGTQVANFSVATSRKYTDASGAIVEEKTWWKVSVFGKASQPCATYLHKGDPVLVEGRVTPDKATGNPRVYQRPDGTYGSAYELVANVVKFLPKKSDQVQQGQTEEAEIEF